MTDSGGPMLRGGRGGGEPAHADPGRPERSHAPQQPSTVELGWAAVRRGNTDGPGGADIGDMTPASVPAGAKPTAAAGAPPRHVPLRPESSRRASAWGETGRAPRGETDPTTEWSDPEPEWEPWPFPDEEPAEGETDGPVFVDNSGRRRRMAVLIGSAAAVVIVVAIVVLATGLSGAAPLSIPGFPDLGRPAPAPVVAPSPNPTERAGGAVPTTGSLVVTATPSPTRVPPGRETTHTPPPHPTKTK